MIPQETMSSEEIYEDLCNKIEKLVYLPGDKISENELCKQYGVSRHIIRTAIGRLKERTLLTVYPQRGTFVSLIDMKDPVYPGVRGAGGNQAFAVRDPGGPGPDGGKYEGVH